MTFVLSKVLFFVLAPLNVAILLLTGAMLAIYKCRNRLAQRLGIAGWLVLVVFGVLPTGQHILHNLEARAPMPTELPRKVDGIILLGGFIDTDMGTLRGIPQLEASADRLFAFTDMAQRYPYAKLIFTSGIGKLEQTGTPEGQLIKPMLERMRAYTRTRLVIEDKSKNTWENATLTKELLKPKPGQTWLLITSAWHMPRALGVFRAAGWDGVIGVPSDYLTQPGDNVPFKANFLNNLNLANTAIREVAGTMFYALMGRWVSDKQAALLLNREAASLPNSSNLGSGKTNAN
ncbi:MAG: YdcF family protein [Proteobacteria bacterium]|nr:YdcF family protein [Pseudomonadota bacterium]